jgi:hypothetical protein
LRTWSRLALTSNWSSWRSPSPDISWITCCDHETGNPLAGLSGAQRARIIWTSFLASSGVDPCDVPFRYGNQHPAVARWHAHLRGLATAIHEISGLEEVGTDCGSYLCRCIWTDATELGRKIPGPENLALTCPQRGLLASYIHAEICWSNGVVEHCKA